ncbi:MAG: glutamate racemase [candidate division WOR-3 bacterium]
MKPEAPIGVFDSGLGGLTVVRALRRLMPQESVIYFGDPARFPYGTKSAETITRFALEDARFLLGRGAKLIVVACHSASSVAMPELVRQLSVPVLGVIEPGAQALIAATRNRRVGVIGTSATIRAGAYERSIRELAPDVEILARATPLLVPLVEEGWLEGEIVELIVRRYLEELAGEGIDALLLGCTHFPLLARVISRVMGMGVRLVDSAEETARAVQQVLTGQGLLNPDHESGRCRFYLSDITPGLESVAERLFGEPVRDIVRVTMPG